VPKGILVKSTGLGAQLFVTTVGVDLGKQRVQHFKNVRWPIGGVVLEETQEDDLELASTDRAVDE